MSRKDFIVLAEEISFIVNEIAREQAAKAVAYACLRQNANFKMDVFLTACNVRTA
jgi:hypothetical protein